MENLPLIIILHQVVLTLSFSIFYRIREGEVRDCCNQIFLVIFCCKNLCFLYISGVVLPVWNPQNPSVGDKVARAIVYFVALIYMFLGMSIIADRFMSSIEVGNT